MQSKGWNMLLWTAHVGKVQGDLWDTFKWLFLLYFYDLCIFKIFLFHCFESASGMFTFIFIEA